MVFANQRNFRALQQIGEKLDGLSTTFSEWSRKLGHVDGTTRSIGAGAESCTQVRAQNANGRVKSAKFVFYIFPEAICVLRKFLDP